MGLAPRGRDNGRHRESHSDGRRSARRRRRGRADRGRARFENELVVDAPSRPARTSPNAAPTCGAAKSSFRPRRRIRAATSACSRRSELTEVPVYRRPVVAVFSSGDELVDPSVSAIALGEIRDSNRYAVAASLRAMGAVPRHYPTLRDEAAEFESALAAALAECDARRRHGRLVGRRTRSLARRRGGGRRSRHRRPRAARQAGKANAVRRATAAKPILGLPGNPTSALLILEAVAAPIVAALVGAPPAASTLRARLAEPARSRLNWTWYVPVRLQDDGGVPLAHPLPLRSFSVSLTARADGYIVMDERDEEWPGRNARHGPSIFGRLTLKMIRPTPAVEAIPATTPFIGPEQLMRETGRRELVRLGANESAFGPSPQGGRRDDARSCRGSRGTAIPNRSTCATRSAQKHGCRPEEIVGRARASTI